MLQTGTFVHEMCHTLGMNHEHVRSDRTRYMKVNWLNIKDDKISAFLPVRTINIDSLDLHSIMQYGLKSFSRNKKKTIELREKEFGFLTTMRHEFSFYDIGEINQVYQCAG
ncbi:hypothetical protein KUTeg_007719 [Tegillarca granosa]|uniref:Metalloendopeptidase n=1 Tax=Tegillarca granosa TaxID=220873 RepID=A0ABQ9FE45_TEGGR|nr:hypothetical protein KUTeg_007719 [Tegillarca granosa]